MDHFNTLKNEQTARIVLRDTALYVFIGTIFAVYSAEGQAATNEELVTLIRAFSIPLSAIMFSIYLSNDFYVSRIGDFVGEHRQAGPFAEWEAYHKKGEVHFLQKVFRVIIVYLLFGGWTLSQIIPVLRDDGELARNIALAFGAIVLVELFIFTLMWMGLGKGKKEDAAKDQEG